MLNNSQRKQEGPKIKNALIRLLGFNALLLQGDVLFVERVQWLNRRLRRGNRRVLDAGCGAGGLSILSSAAGNPTLGLTFSEGDARIAGERAAILNAANVRFEVVDLREIEAHVDRLGTFDEIIACEVIEHILDDSKLFGHLARLLSPGGRLYLTTPYENHVPVFGEVVKEVEDGGHVRFGYTHQRLKELCDANHLQVVELGYLNGYFAQRVFSLYVRLCHVHPKFAWLMTLPLRPLRHLDGMIRKLARYPDMSVTMVCEQRPTL